MPRSNAFASLASKHNGAFDTTATCGLDLCRSPLYPAELGVHLFSPGPTCLRSSSVGKPSTQRVFKEQPSLPAYVALTAPLLFICLRGTYTKGLPAGAACGQSLKAQKFQLRRIELPFDAHTGRTITLGGAAYLAHRRRSLRPSINGHRKPSRALSERSIDTFAEVAESLRVAAYEGS